MPKRSETPGLIRRRGGKTLYWSAESLAVDLKGFPDPLIRLPADANATELGDLCKGYAKTLADWLNEEEKPKWRYDGTVAGLCDVFKKHPHSPMQDVKWNTADSYVDSFKVIRSTVGKRAVRALNAVNDCKEWYQRWRSPAKAGGPERIKRAHDAMAAFRMAVRFGAALRFPNCKDLAKELSMLRFERADQREGQMTFEQAKRFVTTALASGEKRDLYMAIGVAAQFETILRQKDIIGEWHDDAWTGQFTWENIPGGILRIKTSKSRYKKTATFDLASFDLLWPLIQSVPQPERAGTIVKGELDLPVRERSYRKWFREIATAAGIPRQVWNMDTRAGGVTEALESGADLDTVRRAATHSKASMTLRYERDTAAAIASVAQTRKRGRPS